MKYVVYAQGDSSPCFLIPCRALRVNRVVVLYLLLLLLTLTAAKCCVLAIRANRLRTLVTRRNRSIMFRIEITEDTYMVGTSESFRPLVEVANRRAGGYKCNGATQCSILTMHLSLPLQESSPTAPGAGAAEGADEEGGASEGETRDLSLRNGTPAQAALLEVWMGLQGYGLAAEGDGGAATIAFSKLRKALDLKDPDSATSASPSVGVGGKAGEEDQVVAPISSLEVRHKPRSFVQDVPHNEAVFSRNRAYALHSPPPCLEGSQPYVFFTG